MNNEHRQKISVKKIRGHESVKDNEREGVERERAPGHKTKSNRVVFAQRWFDQGRKVGRLKRNSYLWGWDWWKCTWVSRGMLVVEMEMREHPGRDPFKILRFLVLIFFAAWFHPHSDLDTKPKYQPPRVEQPRRFLTTSGPTPTSSLKKCKVSAPSA